MEGELEGLSLTFPAAFLEPKRAGLRVEASVWLVLSAWGGITTFSDSCMGKRDGHL